MKSWSNGESSQNQLSILKGNFGTNLQIQQKLQGVQTSFRWEFLMKISSLREIRILKVFVKKIRQIEVRSTLLG